MNNVNVKIKSVGAYYPCLIKRNEDFHHTRFLTKEGTSLNRPSEKVVERFENVTQIKERKLAKSNVRASDMGYYAALQAIDNGGIDKETIDYIIVAHNWGDVSTQHNYYDFLPNLAARIKHRLGITNENCVAYDILFGCPGWLEAFIQANVFIKAGQANRVLVIGADTVSRVIDPCDIDGMLFGDGAGAAILEKTTENKGILSFKTVSHCNEELNYLKMDQSFDPALSEKGLYLKMEGRKVFQYAIEQIPKLVQSCLIKSNIKLTEIKYLLMHQANGKMVKMIAKKIFKENGMDDYCEDKLPINVYHMGNSSVATLPTLLCELMNGQHSAKGIKEGDIVALASVGAGMHTNCLLYQF